MLLFIALQTLNLLASELLSKLLHQLVLSLTTSQDDNGK